MALVMGVGQGQEVTISEASIKQRNHSSPAGFLWGTGPEMLLLSCFFPLSQSLISWVRPDKSICVVKSL